MLAALKGEKDAQLRNLRAELEGERRARAESAKQHVELQAQWGQRCRDLDDELRRARAEARDALAAALH